MLEPGRGSLLRQGWFLWPLALRLAAWAFLAHAYEIAVFEDVSWRLAAGEGIYAPFASWLARAGDGYYSYPPVYAYMLWVSGALATGLGAPWWFHQLLIKGWLVLADALVMMVLTRARPAAARAYWTAWFVPVIAIGQVQPDLWTGLSIILSLIFLRSERWSAAGALLALGAGVKPFPLVILPFLAIHLIQRHRWTALAKTGAGVAVGTVLAWLPYVLAFSDVTSFGDAIRFQLARPIAGLTVFSGLTLLANAGAATASFFGYGSSAAGSLHDHIRHIGAVYPYLTVAAVGVMLVVAGRQRWSLHQAFVLPMLILLLSSKVVHEHYLLQVLPLLLFLGIDLRPIGSAYAAYVLAAGTPLRFFPQQLGLPATPDALLPVPLQASVGTAVGIGLLLVVGSAALVCSAQIGSLVRREVTSAAGSSRLAGVWGEEIRCVV